MTIWLVRAGGAGEYEQKFLAEKRIYLTWDGLGENLKAFSDRREFFARMSSLYPDDKPKRIWNHISQIWPFANEMQKGDLVILPLKSQRAIQIGEITSDYQFEAGGPDPYFHWRTVKWIGDAVPRNYFSKDLLYSFGAFLTICRIHRHNAEARIAAMRANGWKPEKVTDITADQPTDPVALDSDQSETDLEETAGDGIVKLINARFKGHGLTRLVEAILKAQGYTTYRSPEGADGGADILAGAGPLGFGAPRLCVEVKSESNPIDRPAVDKLLGAVTKFGAQEGLFVSWSGFKTTVYKEMAASFFRVRLWSQSELLSALYATYDQLDEDIKAELPLKRIWTVAAQDPI